MNRSLVFGLLVGVATAAGESICVQTLVGNVAQRNLGAGEVIQSRAQFDIPASVQQAKTRGWLAQGYRELQTEFDFRQLESIALSDGSSYQLGDFIGGGHFGAVFCWNPSCDQVIKIPVTLDGYFANLRELEVEAEARALGIPTAGAWEPHGLKNSGVVVKRFIAGPTAAEIAEMRSDQIKSLAGISAVIVQSRTHIDINPENLIWSEDQGSFVLIDYMVFNPSMLGYKNLEDMPRYIRDRYFLKDPKGYRQFMAFYNVLMQRDISLGSLQDLHNSPMFLRADFWTRLLRAIGL